MARLLILTLSSGEAALPVLLEQLAGQSFQDFEHEVISGLPNRAAHVHLYRTIMDRTSSFELFLKLDADMTFREETSLENAVRATDRLPDAKHFTFPVWDCFTEEEALGVHLFRSGVQWGEITDDLFVDPAPPNAEEITWEGPPAPFVNHGEVVSDFECFSFGVHKFLKVAQRGRTLSGLPHKAQKHARHMRKCVRIRDLYRSTQLRRHQLALVGMAWAMEHGEVLALSNKSELEEIFASEVSAREGHWCHRADRLAHNVFVWRLALLRSLGPRHAFA